MADVIYLVMSGEYSYQQNHVAFTDRALAEVYAGKIENMTGGRGGQVHEYKLLTELPPLDQILECKVELYANGRIASPGEKVTHEWRTEHYKRPCRVSVRRVTWGDTPNHLWIHVEGTDVGRVRKAMSELLARCKAEFDLIMEQGRLEEKSILDNITSPYQDDAPE